MKKIICSLALSLAVALCVPLIAFADYSEGYLYYTVENESVTITGCFGSSEELTVPASIAGVPVNKVAAGAFTGNSSLKKVNLPDTVLTVEEGAFGSGITVVFDYNTETPQEYVPTQQDEGTQSEGDGEASSDGTSAGKAATAVGTGDATDTTEEVDLDAISDKTSDSATGSSSSKSSSGSTSKKSTGSTASDSASAASNTNGTAIAVGAVVAVIVAAAIVAAVVMSRKRKVQAAEGADASNAPIGSEDDAYRTKYGPKQ